MVGALWSKQNPAFPISNSKRSWNDPRVLHNQLCHWATTTTATIIFRPVPTEDPGAQFPSKLPGSSASGRKSHRVPTSGESQSDKCSERFFIIYTSVWCVANCQGLVQRWWGGSSGPPDENKAQSRQFIIICVIVSKYHTVSTSSTTFWRPSIFGCQLFNNDDCLNDFNSQNHEYQYLRRLW